tara:strand:- start:359 stop:496 length:138 start_codon:yes stop_codon:yes gene_type:complete
MEFEISVSNIGVDPSMGAYRASTRIDHLIESMVNSNVEISTSSAK